MHSLLDSPDNPAAPPFLFSQAEIAALEEARCDHESRTGHYTAERLHSAQPTKYAAIARALGEGMGIRQIARAYRVHHRSVAAVQDRERIFVDTQKERTVSQLRQFAGLAVERMIDELDSMKLESLPLATAIALDKAELLSGGVTSRVAHVSEERMDALADVLSQIPEADATVIDEDNRFTGPGPFAKGTGSACLADIGPEQRAPSSVDVESTVLQRECISCPVSCPVSCPAGVVQTGPAEVSQDRPRVAARSGGGGGGRENAGGVATGIGQVPETISAMDSASVAQAGGADGSQQQGET